MERASGTFRLSFLSYIVYVVQSELACAAAFKYQKFESLDDALTWYNNHQSQMFASDQSLIQFAESASDPFQFLAKITSSARP